MRISDSVILTPARLRQEVEYFRTKPRFVYDIETTGQYRGEPVVNKIVWMSMSTYGRTIVIPMGHPNGNKVLEPARKRKDPATKKFIMTPAKWDDPPEQMRPAEVFDILRPLFFDPDIEKGGHGDLFDFLSVPKYFDHDVPCGPFHDNIVAAWVLNENLAERGNLGLKQLTERVYKRKYDSENVGRRVEIHSFNKVATYAYMDAKYTWLQLLDNLDDIAKDPGLQATYNLEMEVFRTLIDVGLEGIEVDVERMKALEVTLSARRVEIEAKVYQAAGRKFNLNSPKQKVDILYGKKSEGNQGLKPWRLTKGGAKKKKEGKEVGFYDWSTDAESLERFNGNPLVDSLLAFQEVDRVLTTYITGYLGKEEDSAKYPCQIFNKRVYPDFVQYGTVTGRFSCRAPNLQNIPRPDTELGKAVRSLFIAGEGNKLVVADYGQVELVVLAHFVGKGALYDGFHQGIDPHTMTAALVFNKDPHALTALIKAGDAEAKHMRQIAKNLNFAIVYGAGPEKVASMSKITLRRAKEVLAIHEEQFPEIYTFKDKALRVARSRKPPHLSTLVGRKRRIPTLNSSEWGLRGRAERQAINSLIQGSAADLIKIAMVRLNDSLKESGKGKLLLTVHDELVTQSLNAHAEECAEIVREAMTGPGIQKWVDVPLSIDLHVVDHWSEAK